MKEILNLINIHPALIITGQRIGKESDARRDAVVQLGHGQADVIIHWHRLVHLAAGLLDDIKII